MKRKKPNSRFGIFAHHVGTLAEKAAIGHKPLLIATIRSSAIDCKIYFQVEIFKQHHHSGHFRST
ncbi:MAG TPA: hypothetical protein VE954_09655 [Oligoflexus sp.]|nr:hypothetical protein [Oligoflexus sp.]